MSPRIPGSGAISEGGLASFFRSESNRLFLDRFSSGWQGASHIFTGVLFALFIVVLLLALVCGTNVYRDLYDTSQRIAQQRAATALIANTVKAVDTQGAVFEGPGPEGPALVMRETIDSQVYETRLYEHQGSIVQEYALAGSDYNPERASVLVESSTFGFVYEGGLLTIWTDDGAVEVAMRTATGGAL